jgi:hypothetical protein
MRRSAPALPLLALALLAGTLGAERSGHHHREPQGDRYHHHAHLGPHRHSGDRVHRHGGSSHVHDDRAAAREPPRPEPAPVAPAAPPAPGPGTPDGDGYYQAPPASPIPAQPPALTGIAVAVAAVPASGAPPPALAASLHAPLRPRPPPG